VLLSRSDGGVEQLGVASVVLQGVTGAVSLSRVAGGTLIGGLESNACERISKLAIEMTSFVLDSILCLLRIPTVTQTLEALLASSHHGDDLAQSSS
jgi:hypothetical protein